MTLTWTVKVKGRVRGRRRTRWKVNKWAKVQGRGIKYEVNYLVLICYWNLFIHDFGISSHSKVMAPLYYYNSLKFLFSL